MDGNFEDIPCPDEHFDIVWSQDAILHSDMRETVLREVDRELKRKVNSSLLTPCSRIRAQKGFYNPFLTESISHRWDHRAFSAPLPAS